MKWEQMQLVAHLNQLAHEIDRLPEGLKGGVFTHPQKRHDEDCAIFNVRYCQDVVDRYTVVVRIRCKILSREEVADLNLVWMFGWTYSLESNISTIRYARGITYRIRQLQNGCQRVCESMKLVGRATHTQPATVFTRVPVLQDFPLIRQP
jgi:hypothetical protein